MNLLISLPDNFKNERIWLMKIIFHDFLGLDYQLNFNNKIYKYEIVLDNEKKLVIEDSFFCDYADDLSYLKKETVPQSVSWITNSLFPEGNFPILFGKDVLKVEESEIYCGVDIPAIVFFMLTRWEEYVVKSRDKHDRFPASSSFAYKSGFLNRPIVNEAIEFLWNCIDTLGIKKERKVREFKIIPTHDIDNIREKHPLAGRMKKFLNGGKLDFSLNPYDTYNLFMDISEKGGWVSRFYFMGCGTESVPYDGRYSPQDRLIKKRVDEILSRGHVVGFHPGYYTYLDAEKMREEKLNLERSGMPTLTVGRNHYLRFSLPYTWRIWEEVCMQEDQTLCYADHDGFRCGTGDRYQVFDFLERKELNLFECPLVIMDGTLTGKKYRKGNYDDVEKTLSYYKNIAIKYKMTLTILYHNTYFYQHPEILSLYKKLNNSKC